MISEQWMSVPERGQWAPSPSARRLFAWIDRIAELLHVEIVGLDRIPQGRALLVANHAFGWDVLFVMARAFGARGRRVWALGEHAFWVFPGLRSLARELGTIDGSPENLETLLEAEQWVLVLPGGLREALKPRELRYRLLWGQRFGFARAAIRHQTPVVPLAAIGSDEVFELVGNAYARGERWLRRRGIPLPRPAWGLPLPRRVRLRYIVGEPLTPPSDPGLAGDEREVRRFRREVAGALHELIDNALAERAGLDLGRR